MAVAKNNVKKHPRKTKKKKEKKPSKYDEKIVVDASFEDLIKELTTPLRELKHAKDK